jgi:hypothetical protein
MQKLKTMTLSVMADGESWHHLLLCTVIFFKKENFHFSYTECPIIHIIKKIKITLLLIEIMTWFLQKCKHSKCHFWITQIIRGNT